MIKLIALDLDGTTLNSQHQLAPETKAALKEAQDKGVIVTIATGRMFRAARPIAEALAIKGAIIAYNGALTADAQSGEIISEYRLDFDIARRLLQIAREQRLPVQVYINDTLVADRINHLLAAYALVCRVPVLAVGDIAAYWSEPPTKLLYIAPEEVLAGAWRRLDAEFGGSIYCTKSTPFYLEALNPAANKGAGVEAVARYYGIKKEEIMVCGDSLNDMELYNAAGLKIAMGNAVPELKARADFITLSNDEHGVAHAVRKFVL